MISLKRNSETLKEADKRIAKVMELLKNNQVNDDVFTEAFRDVLKTMIALAKENAGEVFKNA